MRGHACPSHRACEEPKPMTPFPKQPTHQGAFIISQELQLYHLSKALLPKSVSLVSRSPTHSRGHILNIAEDFGFPGTPCSLSVFGIWELSYQGLRNSVHGATAPALFLGSVTTVERLQPPPQVAPHLHPALEG